jgi:GntR family transcriptional repressor for pyruvate dehydrogenase complex
MPPPPNRTQAIAGMLRDEILRGDYQPGERLPAERDLASRLGVNRGSVREALKQLEQMGLVATRRGEGTTVRHLQEASVEVLRHLVFKNGRIERRVLEQLLDVYEMLLAGASYLAVERSSPELRERARELVRRALETPRPSEFHAMFTRLTDLAAEASGNLVLRLFRNAFYPSLLEVLRQLQPHAPAERIRSSPEARALDAALAAGDADAAERAVRALARERRDWILRALDAYEAA